MAETFEQAPASASPAESAGAIGRWVLAATILGSSMAFIDGTVINVALPVLQRDLSATVAEVQWVVELYTLFLSALILVGGSLGDLYGRRRVYAAGVALFTAASVWCGFAPTIGQLILARAAQGIGGALLVPNSLALISATFPAAERGRAIGTWSAFTAITTAIGPVLGGYLVEQSSWRWVFFINIPLALVVLAIIGLRVPESRNDQAVRRIDWAGALLATLGLGGLVFGLIESANLGLRDPLVLTGLIGGAVALGLFMLVESRSAAAMMPLNLFRSRTFSGANLLTLLLYAALSAAFFFLPFNLIQIQGYSPAQAGAALLPLTLLLFTLSRWSGGLVARYGAKLPLVVGPLIAAAGFALFMLPGIGGSYWTSFFPAVLVLSLGLAITVAPLTTTVMGAVEVRHAGVASGINNAVSRTAGLVAIAVLGLVMIGAFGRSLERRLATLDLPPATQQALLAQRSRLAELELPAGLSDTEQARLSETIDQSFVDGFRLVMLISAGLALASALSAAWLIDGALPTRADDQAGPQTLG